MTEPTPHPDHVAAATRLRELVRGGDLDACIVITVTPDGPDAGAVAGTIEASDTLGVLELLLGMARKFAEDEGSDLAILHMPDHRGQG